MPSAEVDAGALQQLALRLNRILDLQRERSFIVTGFFLQEVEIDLLKLVLSPDDPSIGARGRYQCVPVGRSRESLGQSEQMAIEGGITFSFVQMNVVD